MTWRIADFAQVVGVILVLAFALTWIFTGRESVLLVGAAASLILLGHYERLRERDETRRELLNTMEARDA